MQQLVDIPFSFLATQTCSHCQLGVTCSPIYATNDLNLICGRCCRLVSDQRFRNLAYELLASYFLYPCKNWRNHCSARLKWCESLEHEPECDYIGCCSFMCCHPGAFFKGPREIPHDGLKMLNVIDNNLVHLECVYCGGYLSSGPVYLQQNGQNVCHRCVLVNGKPPQCLRNSSYENIGKMFQFPCVFHNFGCNEHLLFGQSIVQHESNCRYRPRPNHQEIYRPSKRVVDEPQIPPISQIIEEQPRGKQKERGVIKTHSGHIWATLTPQKALFAPPDAGDFDDNHKNVIMNIEKRGRQIRRVDEMENEFGRLSDTESVSTSESFRVKHSGNTTPEILEPQRYPPGSRPDSRESGYQTPRPDYDDNLKRWPYLDLNPGNQFVNDFDNRPQRNSFRESVQRASTRENALLISELKLRQDHIKRVHSIRTATREVNEALRHPSHLGEITEHNQHER